MAEAGAALAAAQAAATEIPYKNIESAQQSIQLGLNAWQTANAIKLKKAEVEDKMAALITRNRQLEFNDDIRNKELGLKMMQMDMTNAFRDKEMDLKTQGMLLNSYYKDQALDLTTQKLNQTKEDFDLRFGLQKEVADQRHQKDMDRQESQQAVFMLDSQLQNEGLEPGTREYAAEYMKRLQNAAKGFSPSEFDAIHKDAVSTLDARALQRQRFDQNEMRAFREKVGGQLFGNPGIQNLEPIIHPESLPDDWTKEHKWSHAVVTPGIKQIWYTDPSTGISKKVNTASIKDLTDLNKEYQSLLEKQSHSAQAKPQVYPLPADKSKMVKDNLYDIPGVGTRRWTGTGLVAP